MECGTQYRRVGLSNQNMILSHLLTLAQSLAPSTHFLIVHTTDFQSPSDSFSSNPGLRAFPAITFISFPAKSSSHPVCRSHGTSLSMRSDSRGTVVLATPSFKSTFSTHSINFCTKESTPVLSPSEPVALTRK